MQISSGELCDECFNSRLRDNIARIYVCPLSEFLENGGLAVVESKGGGGWRAINNEKARDRPRTRVTVDKIIITGDNAPGTNCPLIFADKHS